MVFSDTKGRRGATSLMPGGVEIHLNSLLWLLWYSRKNTPYYYWAGMDVPALRRSSLISSWMRSLLTALYLTTTDNTQKGGVASFLLKTGVNPYFPLGLLCYHSSRKREGNLITAGWGLKSMLSMYTMGMCA